MKMKSKRYFTGDHEKAVFSIVNGSFYDRMLLEAKTSTIEKVKSCSHKNGEEAR